ncbi:MAG: GIY-YIG nuclease family protein [Patescibacteria group bacterium]
MPRMDITTLKNVTNKFPKKPGIYRFLDPHQKPIYIGKASNLKNRVISYARPIDSRIVAMVSDAKSLTFTETGSDIEALILESQLVKKYLPKFNIMLRDDKQYFFVAFTQPNFSKKKLGGQADEQFPRIFLTHQPQQTTRNKRQASGIEYIGPFTEGTALKTTLRALRRIFPYCTCKQKHNVMCLNGHIGACLGFCCLKKPENPNRKSYLSNIRAIKEVLSGKRTSLIKRLEKEMKERGKRLKLEEASAIQGKIEKVRRVFENAQIIQRMSGERIPDSSRESIKTFLGLAKNPVRIEGYDVAHIQGKHTVGAMVVFNNGMPDKNSYRKFKIHSSKPGDDTGALREMLTRRIKHAEWPAPDLVIIDGGMGQLNVAIEIFGNNHPLIALTKNNKHQGDLVLVSVSKKKPAQYPLSGLPEEVKNLILSVDAEAHRFAIGFYRSLHKREMRGKVGRQ